MKEKLLLAVTLAVALTAGHANATDIVANQYSDGPTLASKVTVTGVTVTDSTLRVGTGVNLVGLRGYDDNEGMSTNLAVTQRNTAQISSDINVSNLNGTRAQIDVWTAPNVVLVEKVR